MANGASSRWEGIDALYAELAPQAKRVAFLMSGDLQLAEDAVHDAFLSVVAKVGSLKNPQAIKSYLNRAVVNHSKNRWRSLTRSAKREASYQALQDQVHHDPDVGEALLLAQALSKLKYRQRAVIVLTYYQDLSDQEIGNVLNCPVGTVKSTRARALASLRKEIPANELVTRSQQT